MVHDVNNDTQVMSNSEVYEMNMITLDIRHGNKILFALG